MEGDTSGGDQASEGVGGLGSGGGSASAQLEQGGSRDGIRTSWSDEEWEQWNSWRWGSQDRQYWSWSGESREADQGPSQTRGEESTGGQPHSSAAAGRDAMEDPWLRWDPWSWSGGDSSWQSGGQKWWSQHKGDYSDPPQWASWTHYRLWRRSVLRWHQNTDVPLFRRAEKLLKGMDWQMQQHFDHLSEETLASEAYLSEIFKILDTLAGEKETTEMRRSIRAALYEGQRRNDENLAQYSLRRDAQFSQASKFLQIPNELKAVMLEEQANLSKQSAQNLRVLTAGKNDYEAVRRAMQVMDVGEESLFKSGNRRNYLTVDDEVQLHGETVDVEKHLSEDEDESDETFFYAVEEQDLDENAALCLLSEWKSEDNKKKRRTWSENRR